MIRTVITGTGAFIPDVVRSNEDFIKRSFFEENGFPNQNSAQVIIEKFEKITGIKERRYAPNEINASDMALKAGEQALLDSKIDPETLDQIIVSHNFGDINNKSFQTQNVPSIASRVKNRLKIRNPECIAYDVLFGCPGWVQSLMISDAYFKAGSAKKILLIGTETLSRIIDSSDRNSMIFADGAGACVVESIDGDDNSPGILSVCAQTHSVEEANYIYMGKSFKKCDANDHLYLKMNGRKVYEYAIKHVPAAIKLCLDKASMNITRVAKIFLHQANEKMDEEILKRLFSLYGISAATPGIMPMSIHWLGNSSVATIPTLFDMVRKGKIADQKISKGDIIVFASVGAGMNINAVCYRV